jgi:hypothetical protein
MRVSGTTTRFITKKAITPYMRPQSTVFCLRMKAQRLAIQ